MRIDAASLGDRELVGRIRFGEATAENEFARRYLDSLRATMIARTRNHEDAEDLAQDAMLAVIQALRRGTLASSERLEAFVHGTARNVANNFFRTRERQPRTVPLPDNVPVATVEPAWEREERLAVALAALAQNPGLDGDILRLSLVDGLTPSEIGRALHMRPELVRTHKSRAARRLLGGVGASARPGQPMR